LYHIYRKLSFWALFTSDSGEEAAGDEREVREMGLSGQSMAGGLMVFGTWFSFCRLTAGDPAAFLSKNFNSELHDN
jgi:hypothetical protein